MALGIKSRWLILMLALGFVVRPVEAGKPAPPASPPEAGYIFFSAFNAAEQDSDILQMRADGTGMEVAIPAALWKTAPYGMPVPSNLRYNGEHWWLQVEEIDDGKKYPWGALRRELVVFQPDYDNQGNLTRFAITLTDLYARGIVPFTNTAIGIQGTHWSNDNADTFVSFIGAYRTQTGIESGLYVFQVPVTFDNQGIPFANTSAVDATRIPLGQAREYDWSPDGASIVYDWQDADNYTHLQRHSAWEFAAGFPPTVVWSNSRMSTSALNPQWSQPYEDGKTRIAFASHRGVWERDAMTLAPDGNDLKTLATGKSKGYWTPMWSPLDGSQMVLREVTVGRNSITEKIIRVNRDGSGRVDLLSSEAQLIAWRLSIEAP